MVELKLRMQPTPREGVIEDLRKRIRKLENEPFPRVNQELHLLRKTMTLERKVQKVHDEDLHGSFRSGAYGNKLVVWGFEANEWSGRLLKTGSRVLIKESVGKGSAEEMLRALFEK